jgi:hypothetical protein
MTHVSTKGKIQAKRKTTSRKTEWEKALMTVRKFKRSAEQGKEEAMVVVGKNMVVIRTNQATKAAAHVQKDLENFKAVQDRVVRAQANVINRKRESFHGEIANAYKIYSEQSKVVELDKFYKIYEEHSREREIMQHYNIDKDREDVKNLVDAYHLHVEKANYKELINAYNQQVRLRAENYQADRDRFVRTLKESPSDEAMAFYSSIASNRDV